MEEKVKKNLYLPAWVIHLLDVEGEKYGGPGVVAAASIYSFCRMKKGAKTTLLKRYREQEIEHAYSEAAEQIVSAAEADVVKQKQKRGRPPSEAV